MYKKINSRPTNSLVQLKRLSIVGTRENVLPMIDKSELYTIELRHKSGSNRLFALSSRAGDL